MLVDPLSRGKTNAPKKKTKVESSDQQGRVEKRYLVQHKGRKRKDEEERELKVSLLVDLALCPVEKERRRRQRTDLCHVASFYSIGGNEEDYIFSEEEGFSIVETMIDLKEVIPRVLLPLQHSLGIFQIMKTTPLWAVIHCTLAYLLHRFYFPYTDYKQLEGFSGRVFKKVISHATTAGDVSKGKKQKDPKKSKTEGNYENSGPVSVEYLNKKFEVELKDGNRMLIKDGPVYYITDKMWETALNIKEVAPHTVFVKDHKEIWEEVVTGDIMEFEEVLDSVILDNRAVVRLDHDYFLPINLLNSEDRSLKILNLVGLSLRSQNHIHWLIPALLSFTAAVVGFSTTVRLYVGCVVNKLFCKAMQWLCERMPLRWRRRVYFLGNWVENLKPSNDLELKTSKRDICPVIAGGTKAHLHSSALPCNMCALGVAKEESGEKSICLLASTMNPWLTVWYRRLAHFFSNVARQEFI